MEKSNQGSVTVSLDRYSYFIRATQAVEYVEKVLGNEALAPQEKILILDTLIGDEVYDPYE